MLLKSKLITKTKTKESNSDIAKSEIDRLSKRLAKSTSLSMTKVLVARIEELMEAIEE